MFNNYYIMCILTKLQSYKKNFGSQLGDKVLFLYILFLFIIVGASRFLFSPFPPTAVLSPFHVLGSFSRGYIGIFSESTQER